MGTTLPHPLLLLSEPRAELCTSQAQLRSRGRWGQPPTPAQLGPAGPQAFPSLAPHPSPSAELGPSPRQPRAPMLSPSLPR